VSWKEDRTPDKAGCFSLFGTRYQLDTSKLGRQRVQVRFDLEALDEQAVLRKHHRFACRSARVRRAGRYTGRSLQAAATSTAE
jgi:hypothetical protein